MSTVVNLPASSPLSSVLAITASGLAILVFNSIIKKASALRAAFNKLGDTPGQTLIWLHPFRSGAPVLAPFWPPKSHIGDYYANYDVYDKYSSTILSSVRFSSATPTFWVSDGDALKVVSNNRTTFRRDTAGYEVVSVYGPNMVATEGAEWKRYRAVAKPAFSDANNALTWYHATRVVNEWFETIDKAYSVDQKPIKVDLLKEFTEVALLILSSSAFGKHNSWGDHSGSAEHSTSAISKITFRPAVTSAVDNLVPKVLTPNWLFTIARYIPIPYVSQILNETWDSFIALKLHMLDIINTSRDWVAGGNEGSLDAALLTNLVQANLALKADDDATQKKKLTDDELVSNIFMFLLAGHETSAHSLCFTLVLLAMFPEVQEKMYQETLRVWPDGAPTVDTVNAQRYQEEMDRLEYTTAVFRESLRMFPPVPRVASPVPGETTLTGHRFLKDGGKVTDLGEFTVNIPAQSTVVIDIIGLHYNPLHWGADTDVFRPERFLDTDTYRWPRQAFLAFSAGPRACMGEKFAMVESVCALATVVRKYRLDLPDEYKGKSKQEQFKSLLGWVPRMTLIPTNAFVTVTPRA